MGKKKGEIMSFTFRPGIREEVSLLIGLIGVSGSGKTYTAMRLAKGICGDKPFAVIDTEAGRAKHYAELFKFDHGDLKPPFRPNNYADAIKAADEAGYRAIVVDSCSHEWVGEGGVLDWQEEELTRMAGDDWKKRESCKMVSWIKPKMAHKQMIQRLLQVRANLILCFRAEERIKMEKDPSGKMQIIPMGFQPVCSKEMPYELTVSFLLTPDKPGIPQPIKLQEQHKALFPLDKQIGEESGKGIAEWAVGAKSTESPVTPPPQPAPDEKKERDFVNIMARERKRLGDERFLGVIGGNGFERVDEIVKREDQIRIYKIMADLTPITPEQSKEKAKDLFGPPVGPKIEGGKKVDDYILGDNMVQCPPGGERQGQMTNTKGYCNSICKFRKRCFLFVDQK